jgi:hypothetical protein
LTLSAGDTSPLSRNSCYATRLAKPSHFRVWAFEWVFRAGLSSPVFPNLVFPRRSPGLHPKSRRPGAQRIECPFSLRLGPGSDPPSPTSPFVGSDRIWPTFYSYPQRNGIGARSGRSQFGERSGKASRHSRRMAYCHMAYCHMAYCHMAYCHMAYCHMALLSHGPTVTWPYCHMALLSHGPLSHDRDAACSPYACCVLGPRRGCTIKTSVRCNAGRFAASESVGGTGGAKFVHQPVDTDHG